MQKKTSQLIKILFLFLGIITFILLAPSYIAGSLKDKDIVIVFSGFLTGGAFTALVGYIFGKDSNTSMSLLNEGINNKLERINEKFIHMETEIEKIFIKSQELQHRGKK